MQAKLTRPATLLPPANGSLSLEGVEVRKESGQRTRSSAPRSLRPATVRPRRTPAGNAQQHVRVASMVEPAPAGQVTPAQLPPRLLQQLRLPSQLSLVRRHRTGPVMHRPAPPAGPDPVRVGVPAGRQPRRTPPDVHR